MDLTKNKTCDKGHNYTLKEKNIISGRVFEEWTCTRCDKQAWIIIEILNQWETAQERTGNWLVLIKQ